MRILLLLLGCVGMLACYQPDLSAGGTLTECGAGCPVNHWCREGYCLPEDNVVGVGEFDAGAGTTSPDGGLGVSDAGAQHGDAGPIPGSDTGVSTQDGGIQTPADAGAETHGLIPCETSYRIVERQGVRYHFCGQGLDFADAQSTCRTAGLQLVTIPDQELNEWLLEQSQQGSVEGTHNGSRYRWIGLQYLNGGFVWQDGTSLGEYQPFSHFIEPQRRIERGVFTILVGRGDDNNGDWYADSRAERYSYICEKKSALASDCQAIKAANAAAETGFATIDPDGAGDVAPLSVYCDQSTSSGGWLRAVRISREAGVWNAFEQEVNLDRAGADSGDFNIPFSYFSNDPEGRDLEFFFKVDGVRKGSFYRHVHRNAWNPQINVRTNIWQDFDYKPQGEGATWTRCEGNNYHIHSDWNWSIGREQGEGDACGSVQLGEGAQGFILHGSTSETAEALFGLGEYSADRDWATLEVFLRPASGD